MQNAGPGGGDAQTAARGLRHAQASPTLRRRQTLSPRRGLARSICWTPFRGGRMSLQKEKGLLPQKKNLKPKRESEASGVETPCRAILFVGAEAPTSEIRTIFKLGQHPFVGSALRASAGCGKSNLFCRSD